MEQARLIRAAFLLATATAFVALPPALPRGTVMSSLLDDLAPRATLASLADAQADWRGCDGGWNHVDDFWNADIAGLYELKKLEPAKADAHANDRDWCHVNDFWTVNVEELYTLTGAVVVDTNDPAIKLIELSVASADVPQGAEK
jgi:hypothetical protein